MPAPLPPPRFFHGGSGGSSPGHGRSGPIHGGSGGFPLAVAPTKTFCRPWTAGHTTTPCHPYELRFRVLVAAGGVVLSFDFGWRHELCGKPVLRVLPDACGLQGFRQGGLKAVVDHMPRHRKLLNSQLPFQFKLPMSRFKDSIAAARQMRRKKKLLFKWRPSLLSHHKKGKSAKTDPSCSSSCEKFMWEPYVLVLFITVSL